jgi:uncharacterized protein (TIGR02284 family)
MSTSMKHADTVQDLVRIANDGAEFYRDALEQTSNPRLREVFSRMLNHKQSLAGSLRGSLQRNLEDAPKDGTFAGSLRKTYADLRAKLSSNEDKVYVAQLEEAEDRLLKHFEEALTEVTEPSVKTLLQSQAPQVRACHDEMSRLKKSLNA